MVCMLFMMSSALITVNGVESRKEEIPYSEGFSGVLTLYAL